MQFYYFCYNFKITNIFLIYFLIILAFIFFSKFNIILFIAIVSISEKAEYIANILQNLFVNNIHSMLLLAAKDFNIQKRNYYLSYMLFHIIWAQMNQYDIDILYQFINMRFEASDAVNCT